jgi:peptidoglycan hydrolase-like protein with peptidoglycan-binding domain
MSWLNPAPDTSAIDNATKSILVTGKVEERASRAQHSLAGNLVAPTTVGVNRTTAPVPSVASLTQDGGQAEDTANPDGAATSTGGEATRAEVTTETLRQVVSKQTLQVGDAIEYGALVAEVSGRPVFAVPSSLPLYRDLTVGLSGNDVLSLQQMLVESGVWSGVPDGDLGPSTLAGVTRLYESHGYTAPEVLPGLKGLAAADTAPLPANRVEVAAICPVGLEPTDDLPLVTVVTSPATISARADILQAEAFSVGTPVSLTIGSNTPAASAVVSISEFTPAESSLPAGYDLTVALPDDIDSDAIAGLPITVIEVGEPPTAPAVPVAAIRYDDQHRTTVLVFTGAEGAGEATGHQDGQPTSVSVTVTVLGQVAGYAILQPGEDLSIGTEVVISGG